MSTECVQVYGPGNQAADGTTTVDKYRVCLRDGRLEKTYIGEETFDCGCSNCCFTQCNPCAIPNKDLKYNPLFVGGSRTLSYNGSASDPAWFDSFSQDGNNYQYVLNCNYLYVIIHSPPLNQYSCVLNIPLNIKSYECSPFSITFEFNTKSPSSPCFSLNGVQLTVADDSPWPQDKPVCCSYIGLVDCSLGGVPGVTVTLSQNGEQVDSAVTNLRGIATFNLKNGPGKYDITTSGPSGYPPLSYQGVSLTCCGYHGITFVYFKVQVSKNLSIPEGSISGISIQVLLESTVVASGNTDVNGLWISPRLKFQRYDVNATYNGLTVTVPGCNPSCILGTVNFEIYNMQVCGCIGNSCTPNWLVGASIEINGQTQVTGDDGFAPNGWIIPDPSFDCGPVKKYTQTVSCPPRFQTQTTNLYSWIPAFTGVQLFPADGYHCWNTFGCGTAPSCGCNYPLSDTLDVTSTCLGTTQAIYDINFSAWIAKFNPDVPSISYLPLPFCDPCPEVNSPVWYWLSLLAFEGRCGFVQTSVYTKACFFFPQQEICASSDTPPAQPAGFYNSFPTACPVDPGFVFTMIIPSFVLRNSGQFYPIFFPLGCSDNPEVVTWTEA
jgi:hypothetical protein